MQMTILGSGGCTVIPKPLCPCSVCEQARAAGPPYARTGPAAYLHDAELLIDAPAEIALQLNRCGIWRLQALLLTHLDPDHIEGLRVVEQIALDFRTWRAYPQKGIRLLLPDRLEAPLRSLRTAYGLWLEFLEESGFVRLQTFEGQCTICGVRLTALPVERGQQTAYIYVFEKQDRRLVYAPCDIKPFPEHHAAVQRPDVLVVQPGIFEDGLKHGFVFPPEHVSRRSLYTFGETLALARRIGARQIVFVHLEEHANRGYDDYRRLEQKHANIRFAWDGMPIRIASTPN